MPNRKPDPEPFLPLMVEMPIAVAVTPVEPRFDGEMLAEFEDFWKSCPRRIDKGHARQAYTKARKQASAGELLLGVRRYAAAVSGKDPHYVAHPTTWLNGERWLDEYPQLDGMIGDGRREEPSGSDGAGHRAPGSRAERLIAAGLAAGARVRDRGPGGAR